MGWGLLAEGINKTVDVGMGLLMRKPNDQRQLKQAQRLQGLDISGQKQMGEFNRQQAMKMWEDTGYGAQIKQMAEAGLNPAMMYGMGGGGGQTASVAPGGSSGVIGAAPKGGGEVGNMAAITGMGMQLEIMKAQKANIEANTQATLAGIPNIGKTGELQDIEISRNSIREHIEGMTQNDAITQIKNRTAETTELLEIAKNNRKISDATYQDEINKTKSEALGAAADVLLTKQKTEESKAVINKMTADIMQKAQGLDQEQQKIEITKIVEQYKMNNPSIMNVTGGLIQQFMNDAISIIESGIGLSQKPIIKVGNTGNVKPKQ